VGGWKVQCTGRSGEAEERLDPDEADNLVKPTGRPADQAIVDQRGSPMGTT